MQFSPTVRTVLTAVVAALAVVAVALPTLGAPLWVGIIIGAVTAGLGAVGIVPPQTGGTQVGGVKAQLTSPPNVEAPGPGDAVVVQDAPQQQVWQSKAERANYDAPAKRGFEGDL